MIIILFDTSNNNYVKTFKHIAIFDTFWYSNLWQSMGFIGLNVIVYIFVAVVTSYHKNIEFPISIGYIIVFIHPLKKTLKIVHTLYRPC